MRGMGVTMRRFSAFLMIAALVAVLVPSAALAAKPLPPKITQIQVISTGAMVDGTRGIELCSVAMYVYFEGRVASVAYEEYEGSVLVDAGDAYLARKDQGASVALGWADIGTHVYSWKATLLDRKRNPLGESQTAVETFSFTGVGAPPMARLSRGGCPSPGEVKARPAKGGPLFVPALALGETIRAREAMTREPMPWPPGPRGATGEPDPP